MIVPMKMVGFGPGTLSYLASLVGLYVVALRLAEHSTLASERDVADRLEAIAASGDAVERTIAACVPVAEELAAAIQPNAALSVIGAGPNYGTALFGMAKFIEAAAFNAVGFRQSRLTGSTGKTGACRKWDWSRYSAR